MSNKFTYDNSSFKEKIKKCLPFIGIGLLVLTILSILILPSRFETMGKCNDLGLGGDPLTLLTGSCNKSFNEIIFVVGDTQNTPTPTVNYPDYINASLNLDKASIYAMSVSNAHRNPKLITDHEEQKNAKAFNSATAEYIKEMKAKDNGADYLAAIQTAAESAEDKNKTLIYVIGSGLSDQGLLNFSENNLLFCGSDSEKIAEDIAEHLNDNTILRGATIVWDGLGQTTAPQKSLDNQSVVKLKDIYTAVFRQLGASNSNIRFKNKLNSDKSVDTDSTVKPTGVFFFEVSHDDLAFHENTSDFRDSQAAAAELSEISAIARQCPNIPIVITGYMASGNCDSSKPNNPSLALDRANAVKQLLVANGVQNSIDVVNGGVFDAGTSECDASGWNPELANYRRKVTISSKQGE